jgi:hypothetical protein
MINNTVQRANYKLNQHRQLGSSSSLSIFEVARLLDTVRLGEKNQSISTVNSNLFMTFSNN